MLSIYERLMNVMKNRNASGLKELADAVGCSTDEVKEAALELRDRGLLNVNKRYDSTWRISNVKGRDDMITLPEAVEAPKATQPQLKEEDQEEWIDASTLSSGDLLRVLADLEDEIDIVRRELRKREVL